MSTQRNFLNLALATAGAIIALAACTATKTTELKSPDGHLVLNVGENDGRLYYTLSRNNSVVVDTSYLAIDLADGSIGRKASIERGVTSRFSETWQEPWGEEESVDNTYNQLTLSCTEEGGRRFDVVFRLFDDGLGFRYVIPEQDGTEKITVMDELTEFKLPAEATAWTIPWNHPFYEHLWEPAAVNTLDTVCSPVTIKVNDSLYLALHEAALTDYASLNLRRDGDDGRLVSYLTPWSTGEKVFAEKSLTTPWRTVIVASDPAGLMLSRLMLNLNEPCKIEDTSWLEPGNYIGIWWGMHMKETTWEQGPKHGATTENTRRYIDFAAANGIDGVLVEGWNYGWDGDWTADGHKFDFCKAYPDYDLEGLAEYARQKGVRLIAHNETGGNGENFEAQMDSAFSLYNRLGIKAVKTGYVNPLLNGKELHGCQYAVNHYRRVIEAAARHQIAIDNHEPVMPTGLQRTWPNLMTQEGVRGQEYNAWSSDGGNPPEHTCTLPFTRGLAGPTDFTPGIFNFENKATPGTRPQTTRAKQLALYVVLYSPLQMAADMIENYEGVPEFKFMAQCPTTWAKTLVPHAAIGEYVTVARKARGADEWYIGSITNAEPRTLDLALDFLEPGVEYVAEIYRDGRDADYRTNPYPVEIEEIAVNSKSVLPLRLAASGGAAIRIRRA